MFLYIISVQTFITYLDIFLQCKCFLLLCVFIVQDFFTLYVLSVSARHTRQKNDVKIYRVME